MGRFLRSYPRRCVAQGKRWAELLPISLPAPRECLGVSSALSMFRHFLQVVPAAQRPTPRGDAPLDIVHDYIVSFGQHGPSPILLVAETASPRGGSAPCSPKGRRCRGLSQHHDVWRSRLRDFGREAIVVVLVLALFTFGGRYGRAPPRSALGACFLEEADFECPDVLASRVSGCSADEFHRDSRRWRFSLESGRSLSAVLEATFRAIFVVDFRPVDLDPEWLRSSTLARLLLAALRMRLGLPGRQRYVRRSPFESEACRQSPGCNESCCIPARAGGGKRHGVLSR